MANYPLEWGFHTDPKDNDDNADISASSPATRRYPLAWGWDAPSDSDAPAAPIYVPLRSTLLGGADTNETGDRANVTPVNWLGGSDNPVAQSDIQLAKAPNPQVQRQQSRPQPSAPAPQPAPLSDEERRRRSITAAQELNAMASKPLPSNWSKKPIPADWERQLPKATLDALYTSAARFGVPRELLARILWQESEFVESSGMGSRNQGQGAAAVSNDAIEDLKTDARIRGDVARLNELQRLDRFKGPDAVNLAADFLRFLYRENGQSWPAATAAYKTGRTAARNWLSGNSTAIATNPDELGKLGAYLRYVFQGDPGRFDRRYAPDIP